MSGRGRRLCFHVPLAACSLALSTYVVTAHLSRGPTEMFPHQPRSGSIALDPPGLRWPHQTPQRVADADWADKLRSEDFWRDMRSRADRSPAHEADRRINGAARKASPSASNGTYRTVCVRLCDGYFWPISFATNHASLERDHKKCRLSCDSPAKLYVSSRQTAPIEDMRDKNGQSYRDISTALLYRSAYDENCKCRPHPWEQEAINRHVGYAKEARAADGTR